MFTILSRVVDNIPCCNLNNGNMLREVTVKIGLERIDTQKGAIVETLLNSKVTGLVMSLEFAKKQRFKLKKNGKTNIHEKCGWFFAIRRDLLNTQ